MFTGIIESLGKIRSIDTNGTNKTFWVESSISPELKIDQSVSHNGVCLTVEEVKDNLHRVTAIEETLKKTNLSHWKPGELINLERCLMMNGRLDGHIVLVMRLVGDDPLRVLIHDRLRPVVGSVRARAAGLEKTITDARVAQRPASKSLLPIIYGF